MKASLLIVTAVLLAGCAATPPPSARIASISQTSCVHGALDAQRSFVLCPADEAHISGVNAAMAQPVDLSLDLAAIAADYGVGNRSIKGIQPATYSRIVGRIKEAPTRSTQQNASAITIEGRDFRRIALKADARTPVVLFIES
jgi:hypothetical protein